jgi:glycosyltransferase involved in cell wall biosynthesis
LELDVSSVALVSVVIPCFNHAQYLPAAIGSVRSQDWPDLEIVVVDDGSTDDTTTVAQQSGAVLVAQGNRGLSHARNAGLQAARGEMILFLDADDELLPGAIRSGAELLLDRHPSAAGVVRRCALMDAAGRPISVVQPYLESTDVYRELLLSNFVWTPGAALFRRDVVRDAGGFLPEFPAAADYALLLALARGGGLVDDPRPVVRYRRHQDNMSRDAKLMLRSVLAVLAREAAFAPPHYRAALAEGRQRWRDFYGERLVQQLRYEWRGARRASTILSGIACLVWNCPGRAATHFARKSSRVVQGLPSSALEADEPPASAAEPELAEGWRGDRWRSS